MERVLKYENRYFDRHKQRTDTGMCPERWNICTAHARYRRWKRLPRRHQYYPCTIVTSFPQSHRHSHCTLPLLARASRGSTTHSFPNRLPVRLIALPFRHLQLVTIPHRNSFSGTSIRRPQSHRHSQTAVWKQLSDSFLLRHNK